MLGFYARIAGQNCRLESGLLVLSAVMRRRQGEANKLA